MKCQNKRIVKSMRGSGREYRDSHQIHRGQSRRFSSPEVRFLGGERVPSRVPPYGGDRGEWTVVRRRRRKEFEQADGKRDRIQEAHRRGRRWEDFQRRRSTVRVTDGSELRFSDMEDFDPFDVLVQTFDGNAALHYKTGRSGLDGRRHSGEAYRRHARESKQRARPVSERGRSLVRAVPQKPLLEGRRHKGAVSVFRMRSRGACSARTGEQNAAVLWLRLCLSSRTRVRSECDQYSKTAGHTSTTGSGFSRLMIIPGLRCVV